MTKYINLPLAMNRDDVTFQLNVGYEDAKNSMDLYFEKHPEARGSQEMLGPRLQID